MLPDFEAKGFAGRGQKECEDGSVMSDILFGEEFNFIAGPFVPVFRDVVDGGQDGDNSNQSH